MILHVINRLIMVKGFAQITIYEVKIDRYNHYRYINIHTPPNHNPTYDREYDRNNNTKSVTFCQQ